MLLTILFCKLFGFFICHIPLLKHSTKNYYFQCVHLECKYWWSIDNEEDKLQMYDNSDANGKFETLWDRRYKQVSLRARYFLIFLNARLRLWSFLNACLSEQSKCKTFRAMRTGIIIIIIIILSSLSTSYQSHKDIQLLFKRPFHNNY